MYKQFEKEWSEYWFDMICKLDTHWDWQELSDAPNLTMNIVDKYHNKPWNWKELSRHPNLTIEIIDKYSDKPWDWEFISRNTCLNLTIEIIDKYSDKPLC